MFWNILFVLFSLFWGEAMLGNNGMEESCLFVSQYSESRFFHWYWDNQMCRFDIFYMIEFYAVILLMYSALKGYGYKQEKYVILPKFMIGELSGYFLIYYALLLKKTVESGITIDLSVCFNGFIGGLQFFMPIAIYGALMAFVGHKEAISESL